ncbi:unnamed protein product [Echinostoma caproni]|uniref:DUF2235 domain-containing protein n=1 Tax=Echinostoma caproni TaxID=27848 RepID=A0A183AAA2_9TREM|nr:unnamed protein product [Echinostoma caproni]
MAGIGLGIFVVLCLIISQDKLIDMLSDTDSEPAVILLEKCLGSGPDKCNDVLFTGGPEEPSANVVFFGGDVQTVPQIGHELNKFGALEQLNAILRSAVTRVRYVRPRCLAHLHVPLCLVGFSKGCSVLMQLLYELAHCAQFSKSSSQNPASSNPTRSTQELISKLDSMYWLDGGHSGKDAQWPTETTILSRLDPCRSPKMFIHGTPYQLMDSRRPWKSRDYNRSLELLRQYGLPHKHEILTSVLNDSVSNEPTLESHFALLKCFPIEGAER